MATTTTPNQTKIESYRMSSLLTMYDMHTKFLHRAIDGVNDHDANNRLGTHAISMAWIVGTMVQARYEVAQKLDGPLLESLNIKKPMADELFKEGKAIQDNLTYPPLAEMIKDWDRISPSLREVLADIDEQKLNHHINSEGKNRSLFDMIAFDTYREANLIGQLALWRRLLNYPPLNYD